MTTNAHPEESELKKFASGKIGEHGIVKLEAHLDECEVCQRRLEKILESEDCSGAIRVAVENVQHWRETGENRLSQPLQKLDERRGFGNFRLVRQIGYGGFGVVWLAEDPHLNRLVALKTPRLGVLAGHQTKLRLFREAKATACIRHPNVVQVFEAGEVEGVCYIASEYCEGTNLKDWLAESNSVSPRLAAWLTMELAKGVQAAHVQNILHRDIKPGNILLQKQDADEPFPEFPYQVKVADFGLAKILTSEDEETATNIVLGTANYMAPEQIQKGETTFRSDIFAIGKILQRLVERSSIFQQNESNRACRDLQLITHKAISENPTARYSTVSELVDELDRFLNNRPIQTRNASSMERFLLWCRRQPFAATALGLGLLMLIGSLIFSTLLWNQRGLLQTQKQLIQTRLEERKKAEQKAKENLFRAYVQEVRLGALGQHMGRRTEGLAAATRASHLGREIDVDTSHWVELREHAIECLSLQDMKPDVSWPLTQAPRDTTGIAVTKNAKRYACCVPDGSIEIRSLVTNEVLTRLKPAGVKPTGLLNWRVNLKFSADDRYLAAVGERGRMACQVWDLHDENRVVFRFEVKTLVGFSAAFDFDLVNQRFGFVDQRQLHLVDLADGKILRKVKVDSSVSHICFHPSGDWLGLAGRTMSVLSMRDFQASRYKAHAAQIMVWTEDGSHFAMANQKRIWIYRFRDGRIRQQQDFQIHALSVIGLAFDQTGKFLATMSWDGVTKVWNVQERRVEYSTPGNAIRFSGNGKFLAYGLTGPKIGRWEVVGGRERRTFKKNSEIRSLAFGLNGRLLFEGTRDGLSIRDTRTGELLTDEKLGEVSSIFVDQARKQLWLAGPAGLFSAQSKIEKEKGGIRISVVSGKQHSGLGDQAYRLAHSKDNAWLAVSGCGDRNKLKIVSLDEPQQVVLEARLPQVHLHSLSPDGKFMAYSQWSGKAVSVVDVEQKKQVASFPCETGTNQFSPDGRWLIIGDERHYAFISTEDWKVQRSISRDSNRAVAAISFTANGEMAAFCTGRDEVSILDTKAWKTIAKLKTSPDVRIKSLKISANAERLAASTWENQIVIWDLVAIRQGLQAINLNWSPPHKTEDSSLERSEIEISVVQ